MAGGARLALQEIGGPIGKHYGEDGPFLKLACYFGASFNTNSTITLELKCGR